ncbi:MAG: hypothetical protein P4L55_20710 [Syntrophobacteraceae bacterium]|nr:hypothetical protein [Syntrophobacteraceae bacterium]
MDLAEDVAGAGQYDYLRLDALTRNPAAIASYEKRGNKKVGTDRFKKSDSYYYEKTIKAVG